MITDMTLEEAMDLQKWRPGVDYVLQAQGRMELMKAEIERLHAASGEAIYVAEGRGIEASLNHFYPVVGFDRGPIRAAIRSKLQGTIARSEASEGALREARPVLTEVHAERLRQDAKWGEQNHEPARWLAILGEEFGEVCRAVCERLYAIGENPEYREELIQTAAVAVAMVECYDRALLSRQSPKETLDA